jgi:hypothetical protein
MYIKQLLYKGLDKIPVYIEDTIENSPYYFNIVDIPKVFGPGKNSIRFSLNINNLDEYRDIEVEVIDSYGNTIYHEAPQYSQRDEYDAKVLTLYFYNNITNGPIIVTFVGHAKLGLNGEPIPAAYRNSYSVRYTTVIDFNRSQKNTSRILFSKEPTIRISETIKAYVSKSQGSTNSITVSGSGIYRFQHTYPLIEIESGEFINDMINGRLAATMFVIDPTLTGYQTSSYNTYQSNVSNIFNARTAILNYPWAASLNNLGTNNPLPFVNVKTAIVDYKLTYSPSVSSSATNNFNSYINLQISNLEPVSGYLKYVKLYGKSQGSLSQYELIGESLTENNELLINTASLTQYDRSNVGYFLNSSSFQSFWSYNASNLQIQFNSASLFNSLLLTPLVDTVANNVLFTSNIDVNFQKGSSYQLFFNYVKQTDFILEVYASGSAFTDKNGLGERVFYLDSRVYGPTYLNLPINFLASETGTARLQFKILTGSLCISDVSLKSGINQGFNPSNFNSYFPINVKNRNDVYDFKVELIDDNSQINSYEFNNDFNSNIRITGSNQYIDGNDNLLPGTLNLGTKLNSGIVLDGVNNKIASSGYTGGGAGFAFWSGSQLISGSTQNGPGFFIETGAPYYHSIKASPAGGIEIIANISGSAPTGGVTETTFNNYSSSVDASLGTINGELSTINSSISTINFNISEQSSSIASLNQFSSSAQTAEYYRTLFGIPNDTDNTYNLQIKILNNTAMFTSSIA